LLPQVICDLPDECARYEILRALSRKLPLAADVDMWWVAAGTEGFTGADLGGVLAEAQLAAVHLLLEAKQRAGGWGRG
jgi:ATP-dependent Zn protease